MLRLTIKVSLRRCGTSIALAVVGLAAASPTASSLDVGVVADITWKQPPGTATKTVIDREVRLMREAGVEWVRANVNWLEMEPRRGRLNGRALRQCLYAIRRAREAGLKVLMPISDGVPYWASGDPAKAIVDGRPEWDPIYPPARMRDYGRFAARMARRFAPFGVRVFEIWNEPNTNWRAGRYVHVLRAGYRAVKSVIPGATVLLGGLAFNDFDYLEQVYAAGGRRYFDAVAVHPYTATNPRIAWRGWQDPSAKGDPQRLSWTSFPAVREIRATMVRRGDARKDVWITEFGYSTTTKPGGVSERTQARYLRHAFQYTDDFHWIAALFWYSLRNYPWDHDVDQPYARTGLVTTRWRKKPAYYALRAYAR